MDNNCESQLHRTTSRGSHEIEISNYFDGAVVDQQDDPLTYWKSNANRFPILAQVAETVLGVPASSAAVGRFFSVAGKVFRPDRCRLSDNTFQKLMFLNVV
uniref:HAT C-terminal dimerisation domain-containing protein n=1 Tax=Amphimedon queenslandica TaxID=400682 RepID=A0A1X7V0Z2_AMPQE